MDDTQSIASRIGDFAYLAAVCFLGYRGVLISWQIMTLMSGYMACRYAVKAIKERGKTTKETILTAIGAASSSSGQMPANPASIRPAQQDNPNTRVTVEVPQATTSQRESKPLIPREDDPKERGRWGSNRRVAFAGFPVEWLSVTIPPLGLMLAMLIIAALEVTVFVAKAGIR